eukprot:6999776-Ditylum_brightwellii.AAC.1
MAGTRGVTILSQCRGGKRGGLAQQAFASRGLSQACSGQRGSSPLTLHPFQNELPFLWPVQGGTWTAPFRGGCL